LEINQLKEFSATSSTLDHRSFSVAVSLPNHFALDVLHFTQLQY